MKFLAVDTASNICGVSIFENTTCLYQSDIDTGRTHSENLMPLIQQAFQKTNLTLKNMDLFICDKGPGSFTGIRIGIATIKAFSDSLCLPCIGISSLEVLAYQVTKNNLIASILDCKNGNCYFGLYEFKNGIYQEILAPLADTIENVLFILQNYNMPITFVGDGSFIYSSLILEKINSACILQNSSLLNSYNLGLAGFTKFKLLGNIGENVLPLYLRKPQAQRQLEEQKKHF